ncbi:hypothetical protein SAMN05421823_103429 [Catalinimonas alkaloidigena]|uniref:Uncharacterized protein n=1 Tax=Catalinimonas alkaloidigena TaxID=1075417 RepID=A0A1G9ECY0_9BACT|nr:hypothetical protein [Catalinimonas alkaloidigena]SDK74029.1 hypothetical protein SAMN05421823_103429 [Catalinimonas alkaloidigena]
MENLRSLIELVTKKRIKKIELFDEGSRNKNSNYFQLFDGIHSGRFKTDEEAAAEIYQCDPAEKKYLILKTRLKQKLLNTLFFLDFHDPDVAEYKAVAYECNKTLFNARVLLLHNSARLAIPAVEKALKQAESYYLTEIALECARILRQHASKEGPYKEFLRYCEQADYAENRLRIENLSERYWEEATALLRKSKTSRDKVREVAKKGYEDLEQSLNLFASPWLMMNYYRLKSLYFQLVDDYKEALVVTEETEHFAVLHPHHFTRADLARIVLRRMNYLLHLRDLETGAATVEAGEKYFIEGNDQWVTLHEYYFLLAMHAEDYLRAANIFQKVVLHSSFRQISGNRKERWLIFQAYLHYLYKTANLKEIRPLIQNSKTGFRFNEFMAELPEFSKKKRGLNVARLTVQTLYHLEKMNVEYLNRCTDELARYTRRYPKKDLHFRSECLISLMTNMRQEEFRYYQTRRSSERIYEEMRQTSMQYLGGNWGLEVMPYEALWGMMLDRLKDHRYG